MQIKYKKYKLTAEYAWKETHHQWKIIYTGSYLYFLKLWKWFLKQNKCNSALIILNGKETTFYPFSVVYKITDTTDGTFYIGMCESKSKWNSGYLGSGTKWLNHLNKHSNHNYKREIIKQNFKTPDECRNFELKEINKYVQKKEGNKIIKCTPGLMNLHLRTQGMEYHNQNTKCTHCGGKGTHKKNCIHFKPSKICKHCGGKRGHHYKTCKLYKEPKICAICGSPINSHKKSCSRYNKKACSKCGSIGVHKKTCPHWKDIKECEHCGGKDGKHKKTCPKFKQTKCPICGGKNGHHYKHCKQAKKCLECGYPIQSARHAKHCSKGRKKHD